jgi:hypothetical protein
MTAELMDLPAPVTNDGPENAAALLRGPIGPLQMKGAAPPPDWQPDNRDCLKHLKPTAGDPNATRVDLDSLPAGPHGVAVKLGIDYAGEPARRLKTEVAEAVTARAEKCRAEMYDEFAALASAQEVDRLRHLRDAAKGRVADYATKLDVAKGRVTDAAKRGETDAKARKDADQLAKELAWEQDTLATLQAALEDAEREYATDRRAVARARREAAVAGHLRTERELKAKVVEVLGPLLAAWLSEDDAHRLELLQLDRDLR